MLVWSLPHKSKKQFGNDVHFCPKSVHHYPAVSCFYLVALFMLSQTLTARHKISAHGYDFWTSNCLKKLDHKLIKKKKKKKKKCCQVVNILFFFLLKKKKKILSLGPMSLPDLGSILTSCSQQILHQTVVQPTSNIS